MHSTIAILGAGLAGLNAARLLHAAGVDVRLYEARDRLGGRILTDSGFDLGPSWFWPNMQPDIAALVQELALPAFLQHSTGDVVFERMSREGPQRYPTPPQPAQSFRLEGGSDTLIRALAALVPEDRVYLGHAVMGLAIEDAVVRIDFGGHSVTAEHVIATLPPRVLAGLKFLPALDADTLAQWRASPTWMAPHAKFFALYDHPFWRDAGLSGTAQSMVGPMPEIHDACTAREGAALFGFLGISAIERARMGKAAITTACMTQLVRLFGPDAAHPTRTILKDWANDPYTAASLDLTDAGHPVPTTKWVHGAWAKQLSLAGTEAALREPGYLSGAVAASADVSHALLKRLE